MITFYICGVIISMLLNSLVVIVMATKGKQVNHLDLLMLSLAISDVLQTATGYPFEIYSLFNSTEIEETPCTIAGFSITFLALVSICHLAGISIERCIILTFPLKIRNWFASRWVSLYIIVPSWLYGFLWAVFPLLGWSSYEREQGAKHRCSVDLNSPKTNARSYAWGMLVFCFIIPVLCIGVCSFFILREMKKMTNQVAVLGISEDQAASRRKLEIKHTIMSLVLIGTFIVAWSPYAACVFVMTIKGRIEESLLTGSAILAKTSTLYNPIVYIIFMKDFRRRCMLLFGCRPASVAPMTSDGGPSKPQTGDTNVRIRYPNR